MTTSASLSLSTALASALLLTVLASPTTAAAQQPPPPPTGPASSPGAAAPPPSVAPAPAPQPYAAPTAAVTPPYPYAPYPYAPYPYPYPPPGAVPAYAQRSDPPPEPRTVNRWYGWQTLLADGGSFALMLLGGATDMEKVAGLGVAGYFVGGPTVHWAHGNVGRGFASLGLRAGAPILLGLAGAAMTCSDSAEEFCGLGGFAIGGLLGIAGAIAVDAAALSRDTVTEAPSAAVRLVPHLAVSRQGGATVGLGGTF